MALSGNIPSLLSHGHALLLFGQLLLLECLLLLQTVLLLCASVNLLHLLAAVQAELGVQVRRCKLAGARTDVLLVHNPLVRLFSALGEQLAT